MAGRVLTCAEGASFHYRLEGDDADEVRGLMRDIRYIDHADGRMNICFTNIIQIKSGRFRAAGWADPKDKHDPRYAAA